MFRIVCKMIVLPSLPEPFGLPYQVAPAGDQPPAMADTLGERIRRRWTLEPVAIKASAMIEKKRRRREGTIVIGVTFDGPLREKEILYLVRRLVRI